MKASVVDGPEKRPTEGDDGVVTTPAECDVEDDLDDEEQDVPDDEARATDDKEQDDDDDDDDDTSGAGDDDGNDFDDGGGTHIPAADTALEAEVAQVRPPSIRPIYRVLKSKQLSAQEVLSELQRLQTDGGKDARRVRKLLILGTNQGVFQRVGRGNYTC